MTAEVGNPGSSGEVAVPPPLPPGRRGVLYAVRHAGDATAEGVADALGITVSGARQHLQALLGEGFVAAEPVPNAGRRGRPTVSYHVTAAADDLFPKAYGALANELLAFLEADGDGLVDRMFERRRDQRIDGARRRLAARTDPGERIIELAAILDDDGYLATATPGPDGSWRIVEHNCAIADVARRHHQACSSELDFIRAVLPEASIERVHHLIEGARHCAYEIRPR